MLFEYTEHGFIKIYGTKSRRTDITPYELSNVHQKIGEFMAMQIVNHGFNFKEIEIPHPQGIKTGLSLENEKDIVIFAFMRAGLFYALGMRMVFQSAPFYMVNPKRKQGLIGDEEALLNKIKEKTVILADAVINTGSTLIPTLEQILSASPKRVIVTTIVVPDTTIEQLTKRYSNVDFFVARISSNKYVGKGSTDTGNRLFGTY